MRQLAILGASGHGKVVADCAELCGWSSISFFDDAWPDKTSNGAWSIAGDSRSLLRRLSEFDGVLVAIGNNQIRSAKLQELVEGGARVPVLIHPSAVVSRYVEIGAGSVLFAGAVVNVDCHIGTGAIINTAASIDHDCRLGNAVHISPGARLAGGVRVGDRSWVGIGASVKQLVEIGADVTVGAGAAVISNIPDDCLAIGVPARIR